LVREGVGLEVVVLRLLAEDHIAALHLPVLVAERGLHRPFAPADAGLGVGDQRAGGIGGPAGAVPSSVLAHHVQAHRPAAGGGEEIPAPSVAEAGAVANAYVAQLVRDPVVEALAQGDGRARFGRAADAGDAETCVGRDVDVVAAGLAANRARPAALVGDLVVPRLDFGVA